MRVRAATFLKSASNPSEFPAEEVPEIAFAGRSNVGKSSLINVLVGKEGLARTSRTPGRTQLINWFRIESPAGVLGFVDLPGYGYAKVPVAMQASWQALIESYLDKRKVLRTVVLLVDVRRGVEREEEDLSAWLAERNVPILAVVTKIDKVAKNKREPILAEVKRGLGLKKNPVGFSALDSEGVEDLWRAITKAAAADKSSEAVTIVPMVPDDLEAVDEIERHSFKAPWPAQVFAEELTREWARVDVARERGRVIGFVDYWLVADEIHLLAIATHPDARRRGIARLLLDHLLALGRSRDSALVTLEVRRTNVPALALYERAGFVVVGVRPRYYAEDNEDALVMTLNFKPA